MPMIKLSENRHVAVQMISDVYHHPQGCDVMVRTIDGRELHVERGYGESVYGCMDRILGDIAKAESFGGEEDDAQDH